MPLTGGHVFAVEGVVFDTLKAEPADIARALALLYKDGLLATGTLDAGRLYVTRAWLPFAD